jgi:hypothetical protein
MYICAVSREIGLINVHFQCQTVELFIWLWSSEVSLSGDPCIHTKTIKLMSGQGGIRSRMNDGLAPAAVPRRYTVKDQWWTRSRRRTKEVYGQWSMMDSLPPPYQGGIRDEWWTRSRRRTKEVYGQGSMMDSLSSPYQGGIRSRINDGLAPVAVGTTIMRGS